MVDRNLARVVAPLALVAALLGVLLVIQLSQTDSPDDAAPAPRTTIATERTQTRPARDRPRVYVVKPGDTLSVIADKTGQTLETIEQLNPDVDPQALQTGQRLKLAP
jgi:LysM repeat protein